MSTFSVKSFINICTKIQLSFVFFIGNAVGNIICSTVFGERYECDDPRFLQIIDFINLVLTGFSHRDPVAYIPWIRHFFRLEGLEKVKKALVIRDNILHTQLENHRKTFDPDNIRDLTDSLIKASREKEIWENIGIDEVTDDHIEMIMNDIFIAGSHTTTGKLLLYKTICFSSCIRLVYRSSHKSPW